MLLTEALELSTVNNAIIYFDDSIFLAVQWKDSGNIEFKIKPDKNSKFRAMNSTELKNLSIWEHAWKPVAPHYKINY